MSEKENIEQNELINGFIDQQLNPRQLTELKRILAHNPGLAEEAESVKQVRELLRSLPVESAPKELAQEIQSALERRCILDNSMHAHEKEGVLGLRIRKFAATAAMILVPMCVLGLVVYSILQTGGNSTASEDSLQGSASFSDNSPATGSSPAMAYAAILQFQSAQMGAVGDYVEKKIHLLGLSDYCVSTRLSGRTSFKITCSGVYISKLVAQLNDLWPQCSKASYAISNPQARSSVEIDRIDNQQVLALISAADLPSAVKLAQNYARQNSMKSNTDTSVAESILDKPSMPVLAWDEGSVAQIDFKDAMQDAICFVIEITAQSHSE